MSRNEIILTIALLALCLSLFAWIVTAQAAPAPTPDPEWTPAARQSLGICIMAESDFVSEHEAAALGHVLTKIHRQRWRRFRWSVDTTIRNYCAVFDARGPNYYRPRTRKIRNSTWAAPLHRSSYDPEWKRLRVFVDRFAAGDVPDPCPNCIGWVGETDNKPPTWTAIMGPPDYVNIFCARAR